MANRSLKTLAFVAPPAIVLSVLTLDVAGFVVSAGATWYFYRRFRAENDNAQHDSEIRAAELLAQARMAAAARPPTASVTPAAAAPKSKPGLQEIVARVAALAPDRFLHHVAEPRLDLIENPNDTHAAVELALLYRSHSANPRRTLRYASQAVTLACRNGQGKMATHVFRQFIDQRTQLRIEPPVWESLGRMLLGQDDYLIAAWCLHAGAVLSNDPLAAQKRLIEVANAAGQANRSQEAIKLYQTVLQKYPGSNFADFVRDAMGAEQRKLGAA